MLLAYDRNSCNEYSKVVENRLVINTHYISRDEIIIMLWNVKRYIFLYRLKFRKHFAMSYGQIESLECHRSLSPFKPSINHSYIYINNITGIILYSLRNTTFCIYLLHLCFMVVTNTLHSMTITNVLLTFQFFLVENFLCIKKS